MWCGGFFVATTRNVFENCFFFSRFHVHIVGFSFYTDFARHPSERKRDEHQTRTARERIPTARLLLHRTRQRRRTIESQRFAVRRHGEHIFAAYMFVT